MMKATGIRRGLGLLAVVVAVAAIAAGVLRYGYMQALDGLSQRGEADLALASDRLTGQVQRYRDLAVLMATHPALDAPGTGEADAVLLHAADRTSVLNILSVDMSGEVQGEPLTYIGFGQDAASETTDTLACYLVLNSVYGVYEAELSS